MPAIAANLIYNLRNGRLRILSSGKIFNLPTYHAESRVLDWDKVQELRAGKYTLWDHCFQIPQQPVGQSIPGRVPIGKIVYRVNPGTVSRLEVFDYPGIFALKRDGEDEVSSQQHTHPGPTIYVGDWRGGIYIHGWPPCNLKQCLVVMQPWEEVLQAIAREPELSFSIES